MNQTGKKMNIIFVSGIQNLWPRDAEYDGRKEWINTFFIFYFLFASIPSVHRFVSQLSFSDFCFTFLAFQVKAKSVSR